MSGADWILGAQVVVTYVFMGALIWILLRSGR